MQADHSATRNFSESFLTSQLNISLSIKAKNRWFNGRVVQATAWEEGQVVLVAEPAWTLCVLEQTALLQLSLPVKETKSIHIWCGPLRLLVMSARKELGITTFPDSTPARGLYNKHLNPQVTKCSAPDNCHLQAASKQQLPSILPVATTTWIEQLAYCLLSSFFKGFLSSQWVRKVSPWLQ